MSPPDELSQEDQQIHADEKLASEHIAYWLKKTGCTMVPVVTIMGNQIRSNIDIRKIPPEVLKQLKKAERDGNSGLPAPSAW